MLEDSLILAVTGENAARFAGLEGFRDLKKPSPQVMLQNSTPEFFF